MCHAELMQVIQNSSVVFHEQSSQVMNMSTKPTYKELEQRVQELEQAGSERKKTEELLLRQKQIFSLLVKNSSDILVFTGILHQNFILRLIF